MGGCGMYFIVVVKWNIGVHVPLLLCRCTAGLVFLQSPLKIWMHLSGIPWLQRDSKHHDTTHCSEIRVKTVQGCSCNGIFKPSTQKQQLARDNMKRIMPIQDLWKVGLKHCQDALWSDIFVRFRTETRQCWWLHCVQYLLEISQGISIRDFPLPKGCPGLGPGQSSLTGPVSRPAYFNISAQCKIIQTVMSPL